MAIAASKRPKALHRRPAAPARIPRPADPGHWPQHAQALRYFWTKLTNDWVFNLAGLLAYTLLLSLVPLLVLLLGLLGLGLGRIAPESLVALQRTIAAARPWMGRASVVATVSARLQLCAGPVLAIGVVASFVAGSRLFIAMENCLGVVFRLRSHDPLRQNVMAAGMLLLYLDMLPTIVCAFLAPSALARLLPRSAPRLVSQGVLQLSGVLLSFLAALLLFGAIYVVVPNRPFQWPTVWPTVRRGTLVAATLLVVYEALFPLYASIFLRAGDYGSIAGFAIVILVFFYYLAFILLLGTEINSWAVGQRETAADIPGVLHEVQAHNTTRGAAGPTAGAPHEDLQHSKGAAAMVDVISALEHERRDHGIPTPPRLWKPWMKTHRRAG